jgi:hypothetical protein
LAYAEEGEEHRALCWGDITLKHDNELDVDFLEYNERQTKTRTGEDVRNTRESKPCMYEIPGSEHCPVKMYNAYKSKRPAGVEIHGKRLNNTSVRNHLCQKIMDNTFQTIMLSILQDRKIQDH